MTILEAYSLQDVFPYITDSTLIVVDLDNTLLECTTSFGSFEWGGHLIKEAMALGMNFEQALDSMMPFWEEVQYLVEMKCVEEGASEWIKGLIDQGKTVIGLTGRPATLAQRTLYEVKRNGFELSPFHLNFVDLEGVLYYEGIIFVGKKDKGEVLSQGLRQVNHQFNRILFVDDQKKYVEQVERAMKKISMDYMGFHFKALEEKVNSFDYLKALQEQAILSFQ